MQVTMIDENKYAETMTDVVLPALEQCCEEGWFDPSAAERSAGIEPLSGIMDTGGRSGQLHYLCYDSAKFDAIREQGATATFRRAIVISHGFTEFAEKYDELVWNFQLAGYSVTVLEHRGHGKSARDVDNRCMVWIDDWQRYVADLAGFAETIGQQYAAGMPLNLFGPSMGAGIGAAGLERYPTLFDKAVLSAPMIAPATGKPWKESWCYEHGIADYVAEVAGEDTLTPVFSCESEASGRDREDQPDYKVRMSAAFCFSNKVQMLEYYHNSSWLEHGGAPEKAAKSAFVSAVDKYLRDQNKYQKNESKITWQDIEDCLIFVSNNFSTQTSYENQTKKSITNKFVQEAMTEFLRTNLEIYFIENHFDAEKIAEQVLVNKRSRESAEKQRLNIKKKLSGNIDISNRVQKFVDCRSKDVEKREIYIVEGDSALGSVKLSRDAEYQGIMPVRGKILNCLKADYARIFKSEIITDLIRVLGCGVEIQNKHVKDLAAFDLNNLRWNKVVICTDGDVDGYQIRPLILTMLYRLTPTLIQQGYVYIAETPLFEINCGDKTWFAYSDKEKADIVKSLEGKKYKIDRSKGLGENDPDMMWLTTMNPETRRLIRVMPEDVERTAEVFDLLLGDNLQGRKDHIAENGARFLDLADIS